MSEEMTKFGFKKLGVNNYPTWSKHMEGLLATKECLNALRDAEDEQSPMAKGLIIMCVQDCHLTTVARAESAMDAWDALRNLYQQQSTANLLRLKREFATLEKKRDEGITEFLSRVSDLREQIDAASDYGMTDTDVISAVLNALPSRYNIIKTVIESAVELPSLSDVTAKLLLVESDRSRGSESAYYSSGGPSKLFGGSRPKVYVPPHKRNNNYKGNNQRSGNNNYKGGGGGYTGNNNDKETRECFYCHKKGHLKADCRKRKADMKRDGGDNARAVVALSAGVEEEKKPTSTAYQLKTGVGSGYTDFDTSHPHNYWLIDSGATCHITGYKEMLHRTRLLEQPRTITYGNNEKTTTDTVGDVVLKKSHSANLRLVLTDVLYSPHNAFNLLSVSAATKQGVQFEFYEDHCYALKNNCVVLSAVKTDNGLYKLASPPIYPAIPRPPRLTEATYLTAAEEKDPQLWHQRLGHIGYSSMQKLIDQQMVNGLPITAEDVEKAKETCDTCHRNKLTRLPFKSSETQTSAPLELVHMDLCGPLPPSLGKARYIATFLDDYSAYSVVKLLRYKSDVYQAVTEVFALLENKIDKKVKAVRTDNGGEYTSALLASYYKKKGIDPQTTMPYTPQQNGKAERLNRTLMEKTRSMLNETGLPDGLWGEAMMSANYLRNRSPSANRVKTPLELMFGVKPDLTNLRVFGCEAFVLIPKQKRTKLDETSEKGIFIGYAPNGYRILMEDFNTVKESRDVVFNERTHRTKEIQMPTTDKEDEEEDREEELPPLSDSESEDNDNDDDDGGDTPPSGDTPPHDDNDDSNPPDTPPSSGAGSGGTSPPPAPIPATRTSARTNRGVPATRYAEEYGARANAAEVTITEPENLTEALKSEYSSFWKEAADEEYKSLLSNDTWTLETPPPGVKPIPVKWIFKVKKDATGHFERFKARLVVKGFRQREGVDYNEVFAPVSKYTTVRTLLAKAAAEDLEVQQIDIKTAFLHGELEEDIYMEQPPGYEEGPPGTACKLTKSLYGLKQAPRAWYMKLNEELKDIGFIPSIADPGLFTLANKGSNIYVLIYVDDILIAGKDPATVEKVKTTILEKFEGRDLGEVTSFLGINIARDRSRGEVKLDQSGMIKAIIQEFKLEDAKTRTTPLTPSTKLSKNEGDELDKTVYPYATLVGKLMFLTVATRPDLAYSVGTLARFLSQPTTTHWQAAKGVLRYLAYTKDKGIVYRGSAGTAVSTPYTPTPTLTGFCDADYAGDLDTRKSTTGYLFVLSNGAISWNSKRQPTVAASTTEAEYMAAAAAVKEALWLRKLCESMDIPINPVKIHCDNQSAIKLLRNPIFSVRSKHIDVAHHFARERVQSKEVEFSYVPTTEMAADVLTKVLPQSKHAACCDMMGLE
jgi:transposase InsO family protein